jgi:hypothetical protein
LIAVDYFTKWQEAYAIPKQEASQVAEVLDTNFLCRFGVPRELQRDQDRNVESRLVQEILRITPLHPQSDGMVEHYIKTAEEQLRNVVALHQRDWDARLPIFQLADRASTHDSMGLTPASRVFGRELRLPCDLLFGARPDKERPRDKLSGPPTRHPQLYTTVFKYFVVKYLLNSYIAYEMANNR